METLVLIILSVTLILSIYNHIRDTKRTKRLEKALSRSIRLRDKADKEFLARISTITIANEHLSESVDSYARMCKNLNNENHKLHFENKRLNDIIQNVPEEEDDYSDEELADLIKNSEHVI